MPPRRPKATPRKPPAVRKAADSRGASRVGNGAGRAKTKREAPKNVNPPERESPASVNPPKASLTVAPTESETPASVNPPQREAPVNVNPPENRPGHASPHRQKARLILACVAAAAPVACIVVGAALRTPSWYRPPRIEASEYQAVRDELRDAAQAFSDALMVPGPFEFHLTQAQLNRWVTLRREIYPAIERNLPPEWTDPFVCFADHAIRIAARRRGARPHVVASVDIRVALDGDQIRLTAGAIRVGSLRVPRALLGTILTRPIDLPPGKLWHGAPAAEGNLRDGLLIAARAIWPNGDRRYNVLDVRPEAGVLHIKIDSLGPAYGSRRSASPAPSASSAPKR